MMNIQYLHSPAHAVYFPFIRIQISNANIRSITAETIWKIYCSRTFYFVWHSFHALDIPKHFVRVNC